MRTKTLALLLAVLLCACVGDANSKGELELETATTPLTMTKDVLVYSEVTDPLTGDVAFTDLLSLEPLTAGPNQPRSLYARFVVTRPSAEGENVKHMAEGRIQCFDASGVSHSYVTTTQNIWVEGSQMTMIARMLFKPETSGLYTCKARARVAKCAQGESSCTQRYLIFESGMGNTELVYASPTFGDGWGTDNDAKHKEYTENGNTYVAATHIHGGITAPATSGAIVGNQEYVAKSASFTIPDGPTTFNAFSGIHMTSCFEGDLGCFDAARPLVGARWLGAPAADSNSVVDLRIVATQLYADGSPCVQHVGPTTRLTIQGNSHHQKANIIYNSIPINQCGTTPSRRFTVKTYVERVSGNPVRVERGDMRPDGRFTGFTHTGVYASY